MYPYTSPIILTDYLFEFYGGEPEGFSPGQKQAAYLMAERAASEDLGTYLQETTITGTYAYSPRVMLDHTYVWGVSRVRFMDFEEQFYWTITGTDNIYASMWNQEYGLLDMGWAVSNCQCHSSSRPSPYKLEIVYNTGLHSGTVYNSEIPLALTTYASIILNEMEGHGNEAAGDAKVTEFSIQDYREKRSGLINTVFGGSAKANFAHKILTRFRKYRYVRL